MNAQNAGATAPPRLSNSAIGEGGIRTPGAVSRTAVFKTAALSHSATSPASSAPFGRRHSISRRRSVCRVSGRFAYPVSDHDPPPRMFERRIEPVLPLEVRVFEVPVFPDNFVSQVEANPNFVP